MSDWKLLDTENYIRNNIIMAQHDTLGISRGAGCIDDRRDILVITDIGCFETGGIDVPDLGRFIQLFDYLPFMVHLVQQKLRFPQRKDIFHLLKLVLIHDVEFIPADEKKFKQLLRMVMYLFSGAMVRLKILELI